MAVGPEGGRPVCRVGFLQIFVEFLEKQRRYNINSRFTRKIRVRRFYIASMNTKGEIKLWLRCDEKESIFV